MARPCSRRRTLPLPQVVEEAQRANAPLGVALSALPEGVMQLCEEPAKRVEVAAAERAGPVVPDLSDELTRDRLQRFLVHEGALRVREGIRGARVVEAGEEVAIRPGRPHTFAVVSERAHFTAEFRPAWEIAEVFRDVFAPPRRATSRSTRGRAPKGRRRAHR